MYWSLIYVFSASLITYQWKSTKSIWVEAKAKNDKKRLQGMESLNLHLLNKKQKTMNLYCYNYCKWKGVDCNDRQQFKWILFLGKWDAPCWTEIDSNGSSSVWPCYWCNSTQQLSRRNWKKSSGPGQTASQGEHVENVSCSNYCMFLYFPSTYVNGVRIIIVLAQRRGAFRH